MRIFCHWRVCVCSIWRKHQRQFSTICIHQKQWSLVFFLFDGKKKPNVYIYTTICSILAIRLCLYANSQQQLSRDMFFFLHKTFMICSNDEKVALNFDIYYVIGKYGGKKTKMRVNWNRNFQSIYHNQIRRVVAWHSADGVQRISLFFFFFPLPFYPKGRCSHFRANKNQIKLKENNVSIDFLIYFDVKHGKYDFSVELKNGAFVQRTRCFYT